MSLEPDALHTLKVGILESVRDQLALSLGGVPARVCVVPGAEVAWDKCECGQLAVNHLGVSPHLPPKQASLPFTQCSVTWDVEIVVTVTRCSPDPASDESPPSCEALQKTARIADADIEAVQRGVWCALQEHNWRMGVQIPVGPGGLCVGSQQYVVVNLPDCKVEC